MKPFSLGEYLKNPSIKVVTRDGRNVRIKCTDAKGDCPVIGLIDCEDTEISMSFTEKGRLGVDFCDSLIDLFFDTKKHEGWMNLYKRDFGLVQGDLVRDSEEAAKKIAAGDEDYITTIKVEWEE